MASSSATSTSRVRGAASPGRPHPAPAEEPGHPHDEAELGELGGLDLQAARQPDPRVGPVDRAAEKQHGQESEAAGHVDHRGDQRQHPAVEPGGDDDEQHGHGHVDHVPDERRRSSAAVRESELHTSTAPDRGQQERADAQQPVRARAPRRSAVPASAKSAAERLGRPDRNRSASGALIAMVSRRSSSGRFGSRAGGSRRQDRPGHAEHALVHLAHHRPGAERTHAPCSIMPTTTSRGLPCASFGPHDASQDVSCLSKTSAVPVLPPMLVLIGEPSKAMAPDTW